MTSPPLDLLPSRLRRPATVAVWLTASVVVLVAGASAAGLLAPGLYNDGAAVGAMFRGYDLVTLVLVAPALAVALLPAVRHRAAGSLLRIGMLTYCLYNYAYYLFGADPEPASMLSSRSSSPCTRSAASCCSPACAPVSPQCLRTLRTPNPPLPGGE